MKFLLHACTAGLAAATLLAACGGGSSEPPMMGNPSQASGVISAFGSIFIGGTEYATSSATSILDGDNDDAPASPSVLQVGMTVDVDAQAGGGMLSASLVRFTSVVRGEVDIAPGASGTAMTVLGQPVQITSSTSFIGTNGLGNAVAMQNDIGTGDYVVVFGYLDCTSNSSPCTAAQATASLVVDQGIAPAGAIYRVKGFVSKPASASFAINGLTVDLSSTTVCMPSPCSDSSGSLVAVRSNTPPTGSGATVPGTLTLAATAVRADSQAPVLNVGATTFLEGPATQIDTAADTLVVRGITINAPTLASTVAGLTNGEIVEVTGTVASDTSIDATAIAVERHATFTLMGPLDPGFTSASTTVSVLGVVFTINADTRFADHSLGVRPFNSSNFASVIASGDQVLVSGYPTTSGPLSTNMATRVERVPSPPMPIAGAIGLVSSASAGTGTTATDAVVVGGVTITVQAPPATMLYYRGGNGAPTLAGFLAAAQASGAVVAAMGTETTGTTPDGISAVTAAVIGANAVQWGGGPP
jgi:hypothetical protein